MIPLKETNAILSNAVLKEERGVAGHKYKEVVDEIVKYCQENIGPRNPISAFFKNLTGKSDTYKITIPHEITSKIDFIETLDINITFSEMGSKVVIISGGGSINIFRKNSSNFTDDGKLAHAVINLDAFHYHGEILTRTLTNSLYHELNHGYDVWSRGVRGVANYVNDINRGYAVKDNVVFSSNSDINQLFQEIFYRLFIPTEFNALVSGVYGDLRGMNSSRENFRKDIHNTQAGWVLDKFTNNFDNCLPYTSVDALMEACKSMGIDDVSRQDPHTFLITFKLSFEKKVREAWKRIGRTAAMWYDDKEEMELYKNDITTYGKPIH